MRVAPQAAGSATAGGAGRTIQARVQRFGDAVDTDAIIPGEFCHLTNLTELGEKCLYFVRPEFRERVKQGATIVVAEEGWGSGSSREHAVWALQGAGVQAIIAKSYAFIHKRNLVNEALPYLVIRDPEFYELVGEGAELKIDLANGCVCDVASGREFQAQMSSPMIQALTAEGGLVPAIQRHGKAFFAALTA
jgi:aconitate hydratase/homoaconitate hydratase